MASFQLKQTGAQVQKAIDDATKVVANPSTTASAGLNKITIGETTYSVQGGGGTYVEANPEGEATDTLVKVTIGETVYEIAGGEGYNPVDYVVSLITAYNEEAGVTYYYLEKNGSSISISDFLHLINECEENYYNLYLIDDDSEILYVADPALLLESDESQIYFINNSINSKLTIVCANNQISTVEYDSISSVEKTYVLVDNDGSWEIQNKNGDVIVTKIFVDELTNIVHGSQDIIDLIYDPENQEINCHYKFDKYDTQDLENKNTITFINSTKKLVLTVRTIEMSLYIENVQVTDRFSVVGPYDHLAVFAYMEDEDNNISGFKCSKVNPNGGDPEKFYTANELREATITGEIDTFCVAPIDASDVTINKSNFNGVCLYSGLFKLDLLNNEIQDNDIATGEIMTTSYYYDDSEIDDGGESPSYNDELYFCTNYNKFTTEFNLNNLNDNDGWFEIYNFDFSNLFFDKTSFDKNWILYKPNNQYRLDTFDDFIFMNVQKDDSDEITPDYSFAMMLFTGDVFYNLKDVNLNYFPENPDDAFEQFRFVSMIGNEIPRLKFKSIVSNKYVIITLDTTEYTDSPYISDVEFGEESGGRSDYIDIDGKVSLPIDAKELPHYYDYQPE